jgi:hypothetical protein
VEQHRFGVVRTHREQSVLQHLGHLAARWPRSWYATSNEDGTGSTIW